MTTIRIHNAILFILLLINSSASSQWEMISQPDSFYKDSLETNNIIACGDELFCCTSSEGFLFHSLDEGNSWLEIEKPANDGKELFTANNILFFETFNNEFFRSTDNGNKWLQIDNSFLSVEIFPDFFSKSYINKIIADSTEIFMGTTAGVFCSQDNGISWKLRSNGLPNPYHKNRYIEITSLLFVNSKLYAGTSVNGIFVSSDRGNNWNSLNKGLPSDIGNPSYVAQIIDMIDLDGLIYASCRETGTYKLLNDINTWEKVNDGILENTVESFSLLDTCILAITTKAIYCINNKATSWKILYNGSYFNGSIIEMLIYNSKIYIGGNNSGIFMSSDNGLSWVSRNEGIYKLKVLYPSNAAVFSPTIAVYNNDGSKLLTTDEGNTWNKLDITEANIDNYVSQGTNFIKLFNSYYIKTPESNWKRVYGPSYSNERDLIYADTSIITVGEYGIYYTTINNRAIYQNNILQNWNLSFNLESYALTSFNDNIFVGTNYGVWVSTNFGINWHKTSLDTQKVFRLISNRENILALTENGLYRSTDEGSNWNKFNIGVQNIIYMGLNSNNIIVLTTDFSNYPTLWKNDITNIFTEQKEENIIISEMFLSQNYPNPFNPTTKISYSIPKSSLVSLKVYDIIGKEISTLVNEEKPAGNYEVEFDGSRLTSGIYFCILKSSGFYQSKKMIMLK